MMITRTSIRAGALTVYGTQGCSWTQKQLDYLKKKDVKRYRELIQTLGIRK